MALRVADIALEEAKFQLYQPPKPQYMTWRAILYFCSAFINQCRDSQAVPSSGRRSTLYTRAKTRF